MVGKSEEDMIAEQALTIAKRNVHAAMAYVQNHKPYLFMLNSER